MVEHIAAAFVTRGSRRRSRCRSRMVVRVVVVVLLLLVMVVVLVMVEMRGRRRRRGGEHRVARRGRVCEGRGTVGGEDLV
jgi:hypothetical protein